MDEGARLMGEFSAMPSVRVPVNMRFDLGNGTDLHGDDSI